MLLSVALRSNDALAWATAKRNRWGLTRWSSLASLSTTVREPATITSLVQILDAYPGKCSLFLEVMAKESMRQQTGGRGPSYGHRETLPQHLNPLAQFKVGLVSRGVSGGQSPPPGAGMTVLVDSHWI